MFGIVVEEFGRLMILFSLVHLSPFVPYAKAWLPSSTGVFLVKSFLLALSNLSGLVPSHLIIFALVEIKSLS